MNRRRIQFPTIFILLLALLIACNHANNSSNSEPLAANPTLPIIKNIKGFKQLYVNNEPFLIIGAELLNSSASSIDYMQPIWPRLKALNMNTLLLPITWQQFEKQEGVFDYSLIDSHIENAHKNGLHLILLWFGSWKNGSSDYTPEWIKTNTERFPRMHLENGEMTNTISNLCNECLNADKKAYMEFMKRIVEVDIEGTVIMIQIENEVGLFGESRDFSSLANERFKQKVPTLLINYLNQNIGNLKPNIKKAYIGNGSKTSGTWEDLFGKSLNTNEIFMAWHYATYINELSLAGKAIHNIPTFVNAWLAVDGHNPGYWPSGGPNQRMLDIWKAAAPGIDVFAVDNYRDDFDKNCKDFVYKDNPLFIPEACAIWRKDTVSASAKAFYTIGHHNAMCFSPFGIDHDVYHSSHPIKIAYKLLNDLMPLITQARLENKINAFMEYDKETPSSFVLGNYKFTAKYPVLKKDHINGFGLAIQIDDNEFLVAGNAFTLEYEPVDTKRYKTQLISVEEGSFIDGKWKRQRILNGDEFAIRLPAKTYDLKENILPNEIGLLKVKLFQHKNE